MLERPQSASQLTLAPMAEGNRAATAGVRCRLGFVGLGGVTACADERGRQLYA